jgi:hypothetical protein
LNLWYQNLSLNQMGYGSNDKVDFVYFGDDGMVKSFFLCKNFFHKEGHATDL